MSQATHMQYDWTEQEESLPSYLSRLTQAPLLTSDEEVVLTRAAQTGDAKARQRLVESNMRLVINIAKSYRSRAIPIEDLIQEGAIGLMHAVERFDPEKGFRFSTYATHWIKQSIGRALDNKAKAIRIPAHISQSLRKIERERARLVRELGREPSAEQVAAAMGISTKRLVALLQASQDMLSLDAKVGDGDNATLANVIKDDSVGNPETECLSGEMAEELQHILMELNDRERRVMTYRLKMTNEGEDAADIRDELVKELQLSRERIRQIELQAIKKLRAVAQQRRLRELLSG
ncbi:MAG TPA: RNA polymerase sigma factor RpoD/SigA [Fimbriimonadaceae bacterium]|nr:RNA polymerase sigma factor RpoD/SigA [Fimbriimonadaceae bacterium]